MKKFGYTLALSFGFPLLAAAQGTGVNISYINSILTSVQSIIKTVFPIVIGLSVLYFIWGLFQLFLTADDDKKEKAKKTIIYGIIALFVMVSVWGIVNLLANTLNINKDSAPTNIINQLPLN